MNGGLPQAPTTDEFECLDHTETVERSWPIDVRERAAWMPADEKMPFAKYHEHPALPYYREFRQAAWSAKRQAAAAGEDTDAALAAVEAEHRTTSDPRRSWSDPSNWRDFDVVDEWVRMDPPADDDASLVGRAFIMQRHGDPYRQSGEPDPYLFADGDNVRDPETGEVITEFVAAIETLTDGEPTFMEVSMSGGGEHGLVVGSLPEGTRTKYIQLRDEPVFGHDEPPMLELYEGPKVAVLTGKRIGGTPENIAPADSDGLAQLLDVGTDAHPNVLAAAAERAGSSAEGAENIAKTGIPSSSEASATLPDEAPENLPRCYKRALRARYGDPEAVAGVRLNNHGVNLMAANLGVHAGYSVEECVEHFATFLPDGKARAFNRQITRKSLAGTKTKAENDDLAPPTTNTLREVGLFDADEQCSPSCPIHDSGEEQDEASEDEPLAHDVTLEPATAWRAAGAVTPSDLDPDDEHGRELDIEVNDDGTGWECPCCENDIDVVRAVALQEGLVDRCDDRLGDRLYDEAYRRARRAYGAPLPEYVTEETATERWDVIQGALEQLGHWHLDSITSEVTGQGDSNDVVAEINPCWEDSNSGKRVIAFRDGPFYCREHKCVIDPVRFVALEEGIIDECSDDLGGELFREAYIATRERGAPLPRWTVGNPDHQPVLPPAEELVGEFATDVDALNSAREDVEDLYRQAATDASAAHLLRALPSLGKTTSAVKTAVDEPTLYLGPRKELQKEVEEKAKEYGVSWMHLPVLSENSPDDEVVGKAVRLVREEGKDLLRDYEDLFDRATPDEDEDGDDESDESESRDDGQQDPTDAVASLEDAHNAGHGSLSGARLNAADALAGAKDHLEEDEEDEEVRLDRASCPTANGGHGEALQLAIHVARELGHSPRDIHVADKQLFGVDLDCQHDGECPYSEAWSTATDPEAPIDLLIASYGHAHVGGARTHYSTNEFESTVLEPRTVVFDEFPGEAFAESFGSEALDHATWLASELVEQVNDRQDMIECDLWANDWVRAWLRGQGENTITGQLHLTRLRYADACRRIRDAGEESQHDIDDLVAGLVRRSPGTWSPDELSECLNACPTAAADTPIEELKGALTDAIGALADLTPLVATHALLSAAGLTTSHNESNGDDEDEDEALGSLVDRAIEACFEDSDDGAGLIEAARKAVRGGEEGCQALSVHATDAYAHPRSHLLLYGAIVNGDDENEGKQIRTPSFGFDSRRAGANLKRGRLGKATVLFDRNHHGAYVHDPPEFRDRAGVANPVVGLDATGRPDLWSLAIGREVELTDIHENDDERRAFLQNVLNLQVVQTTPHMKFYEGSTRSKNFDADIALVQAAGEEFGKQRIRADRITSTGKPGVITTKCVRNELEGPLAGDVDVMDNYGNVTGSNELSGCRLGVVLGTQHYGDHTVEKWAALAGESVSRTGHGTTLDYDSEIANTYLKHMSEDQTMQAILRFGRDEGGAVVFAHTAALRDEVPVVADGAVTTAFSRTAREVRDAALPYVGREEPFTVSDIEERVDCSRRSIQRALAEFADLGYLERHTGGVGRANEFRPLADPGVGDVELPTLAGAGEGLGRPDSGEGDSDDSRVYYTWSVGVHRHSRVDSRFDPSTTATLPAPTATVGVISAASHGT